MRTDRIVDLARRLGAREAERRAARNRAQGIADRIHGEIEDALRAFARAAGEAGAPHLDLMRLDPVEPDDKSVRAFQIRIRRGRFQALIICKDRDEVMLVGPFRRGSAEEPCRAIHLEDAGANAALDDAIEGILVDLVERSFAK